MNNVSLKRACLAVAMLCLASASRAVPITYTYIGSTYTDTEVPDASGLTRKDCLSVSFTMDSSLWGSDVRLSFYDVPGLINSGPYQVGFDSANFTTDLSGGVVAWSLFGAGPGLDIFTQGSADGSGRDLISIDNRTIHGGASVYYQSSPRNWRIDGVPGASRVPETLPIGYAFATVFGLLAISRRSVRSPQSRT
jgi:hypothetical protein